MSVSNARLFNAKKASLRGFDLVVKSRMTITVFFNLIDTRGATIHSDFTKVGGVAHIFSIICYNHFKRTNAVQTYEYSMKVGCAASVNRLGTKV